MDVLKTPNETQGVSFGKRRKIIRRKQKLKQFFLQVIQNLMVEITVAVILNLMY